MKPLFAKNASLSPNRRIFHRTMVAIINEMPINQTKVFIFQPVIIQTHFHQFNTRCPPLSGGQREKQINNTLYFFQFLYSTQALIGSHFWILPLYFSSICVRSSTNFPGRTSQLAGSQIPRFPLSRASMLA